MNRFVDKSDIEVMQYFMIIVDENGEREEFGRLSVSILKNQVIIDQKKSVDSSSIKATTDYTDCWNFKHVAISGSADQKPLEIDVEKKGSKIRYGISFGAEKNKGKLDAPDYFFENNTWTYILPSALGPKQHIECLVLVPEGPAFVGVTVSKMGRESINVSGSEILCYRVKIQPIVQNASPQFALYNVTSNVLERYTNRNFMLQRIH